MVLCRCPLPLWCNSAIKHEISCTSSVYFQSEPNEMGWNPETQPLQREDEGECKKKRESAGSSPDPFLHCSQCFTCILLVTQMQECISIVKYVQDARWKAGKFHQILSNSTLLMYYTTQLNKQSSANNSLWPEVKPQQIRVVLCISFTSPSQMPLSKALHSKHLWFYSVKQLKTKIFWISNSFAVEVALSSINKAWNET